MVGWHPKTQLLVIDTNLNNLITCIADGVLDNKNLMLFHGDVSCLSQHGAPTKLKSSTSTTNRQLYTFPALPS